MDENLTPLIEKETETYERLFATIENNLKQEVRLLSQRRFRDSLKNEVTRMIKPVKNSKLFTDWNSPMDFVTPNTSNIQELETFYKSQKNSKTYSPELDYLINKDQWNLKKGQALQKQVKNKIKEKKESRIKKFAKGSKEYEVLGEFYDLLASLGIDEVGFYIELEHKDLFKKAAKAFTTFKKPEILQTVIQFFKPDDSSKKTPTTISETLKTDIKTIENRFQQLKLKYRKKEKDLLALKKDNENLKKRILKKIENTFITGVKIKVSDPKYIDNARLPEIENAIRKEYQKEIQKTYDQLVRSRNQSNPQKYNKYLKGQLVNLTSQTNVYLKDVLSNIPIICPCCFRDIKQVSRCVRINPACR